MIRRFFEVRVPHVVAGLLLWGTAAASVAVAEAPLVVRIAVAEDRRLAGPDFLPYLSDPDPAVRARAALALGRIGRAEHVGAIEPLLRDPVVAVRTEAAFALGEIEDSTAAAALARHLLSGTETEPEVRALCVEGLGKLGEGAGACRRALLDPDPLVARAALLAAWKIPDAAPFEDCLRLAASPHPEVRRAAGYCLMRLAGTKPAGRTATPAVAPLSQSEAARAAARLRDLSQDADERLRAHAVRGLGAFGDPATTAALCALVADPDWRVRVEVARALAASPREFRMQEADPLLRDRHQNVRVAAVEALATLGRPEEALQRLESLLKDSRSRIREVAYGAYLTRQRAQGDPIPGPAIDAIERASRQMLRQTSWRLRVLAADGAVLLPLEVALPILEEMLRDEPRVARAAVDPLLQRRARMRNDPVLAQMGRDLETLLSSPDPVLRAVTLGSLAEIFADSTLRPDASDWMGLESIFDQSRRYAVSADRSPDVRLAIVEAAARLAGRPGMERFLLESCEDPEYLVRRTAVEALQAAGRTPPRAAEPVETARSEAEWGTILEWARADHWAQLETQEGAILVRLFSQEAPLTCWNFARLAGDGFFDRSLWHRVVPDFVLQAGCDRGDGYGGSDRTIRCEINRRRFEAGTLGMALSGKDTGTSQFFLTHSEQPHLDGRYTVFGRIESGQDAADRILQGANLWSVRILDQPPEKAGRR